MRTSKYLERFTKLQRDGADLFTLPGNRMLIEIFEKEELKSAGGIVLAVDRTDHRSSTQENRALVGLVLLSGTGYSDDDGNPVPMDYQPGMVVVLNELGIRYYSEFPGVSVVKQTLGLTSDSDVQMSFPSMEAFEKAKRLLNE